MNLRIGAFEEHARARVKFLTWMNKGLPEVAGAGQLSEKEALDRTPGRHAPPQEPRGKYARVIEHEQVARLQVLRKLVECRVDEGSGFGIAAQHEEPRSTPLGWRFLSYQLIRKLEIELIDIHRARNLCKPGYCTFDL
jgi:hypothetical protein